MGKIIPLNAPTEDELLADAMDGLDLPALWIRRSLLKYVIDQDYDHFQISTLKRRKSAEDKVIIDRYWKAKKVLRIVEDAIRTHGVPVEQLG